MDKKSRVQRVVDDIVQGYKTISPKERPTFISIRGGPEILRTEISHAISERLKIKVVNYEDKRAYDIPLGIMLKAHPFIPSEEFRGRDLLSIDDLSREEIDFILDTSAEIDSAPEKFQDSLSRKMMIPMFFEDSSRTTTSFKTAMLRLGGQVCDFDCARSSVNKKETMAATARTMDSYSPDIVVIRHSRDGTPQLFADILSCPVINAGDGHNEHPTQTILDLYTIRQHQGRIAGTEIMIAGDLRYGRVPHSLLLGLAKYPCCKAVLVSPEPLRMPEKWLKRVKGRMQVEERDIDSLEKTLGEVALSCFTRIQRERFPPGPDGDQQYAAISRTYHITLPMLRKNAPKNAKFIHPLPNAGEISVEAENSSYALCYTPQERNGLVTRKGIIYLFAGENKNGGS